MYWILDKKPNNKNKYYGCFGSLTQLLWNWLLEVLVSQFGYCSFRLRGKLEQGESNVLCLLSQRLSSGLIEAKRQSSEFVEAKGKLFSSYVTGRN